MNDLSICHLFAAVCAAVQVYTSPSTPASSGSIEEETQPHQLAPTLFPGIDCSGGKQYDRALSHRLALLTEKYYVVCCLRPLLPVLSLLRNTHAQLTEICI